MTSQDPGAADRRGPTTAQLRDDIQSGRTGDKVAGFDPAASPLGTDDEAAGTPPTPERIALARAQEGAGASSSAGANASTPDLQPDARVSDKRGMSLGLILGLVAAVVLVIVILTQL